MASRNSGVELTKFNVASTDLLKKRTSVSFFTLEPHSLSLSTTMSGGVILSAPNAQGVQTHVPVAVAVPANSVGSYVPPNAGVASGLDPEALSRAAAYQQREIEAQRKRNQMIVIGLLVGGVLGAAVVAGVYVGVYYPLYG